MRVLVGEEEEEEEPTRGAFFFCFRIVRPLVFVFRFSFGSPLTRGKGVPFRKLWRANKKLHGYLFIPKAPSQQTNKKREEMNLSIQNLRASLFFCFWNGAKTDGPLEDGQQHLAQFWNESNTTWRPLIAPLSEKEKIKRRRCWSLAFYCVVVYLWPSVADRFGRRLLVFRISVVERHARASLVLENPDAR